MSSENDDDATPRRRLSCSKYFDARWFCYSPVHLMQQYYRVGSLDNCSGEWSTLFHCLNLKTKRVSEVEEILGDWRSVFLIYGHFGSQRRGNTIGRNSSEILR